MKVFESEVYRLIGHAAHWVMGLPSMILAIIGFSLAIMTLVSHWVIVKRAGYAGCWSLMLLVPCVNILFLLGFAFTRWPIEGKRSR
ncbi:MAG: hypothetical protein JSS66_03225 [Armatimonadetes bacterium]|nr:hypothetical protein [Armatimonadota bacterium]